MHAHIYNTYDDAANAFGGGGTIECGICPKV